jgi:hypothetical protein
VSAHSTVAFASPSLSRSVSLAVFTSCSPHARKHLFRTNGIHAAIFPAGDWRQALFARGWRGGGNSALRPFQPVRRFQLFSYDRGFNEDGIAYAGQLRFRSVEAHYDWFLSAATST